MASKPLDLEYVEGVVTNANDKGIKLDSYEDGWLNVSKYADPQPLIPAKGTRVRVGIDSKGFLYRVEPAGRESAPTGAPAAAATNGANGHPVTTMPATYPAYVPDPDKDLRITRMAVLNTATAILSSGGQQADPQLVMVLADTLECWVLRTSDDYAAFTQKLGAPQANGASKPVAPPRDDYPDPAVVLGQTADEATQADFYAVAGGLRFKGVAEMCQAVGATPGSTGQLDPLAIRGWVNGGHSWDEGIQLLRAWRDAHPVEASDA